jgi:hypothetical protein
MGIRSNAYFGVEEQLLEAVVRAVQDALHCFDAAQYGVSELRIDRQDANSFVIKLKISSDDADAERAVEAIKEILDSHFQRGSVRERQRELTLA